MIGANTLLILTYPSEVAEMEQKGQEVSASPTFESAMAEVHGNQSGAALKSILNASMQTGTDGPSTEKQREFLLLREDLVHVLTWV